MTKQNPEIWNQLSHAREKLDTQLQDSAEVYYVDIGYGQEDGADDEPSLRVHVSNCDNDSTFPSQVDGVPVVIIE